MSIISRQEILCITFVYMGHYLCQYYSNHIDNRAMLPRSEVWYMDPYNIRSKNILKLAYPNGIKSCEIWITETQMIFRKKKI